MSVGVYSPELFDVIISKPSLGLSHVVTGYAQGSGVTLAPLSDRQSAYFSVKGEFSVNRHAVKAYTLTVHLAQTSRSNDIFLGLHNKLREYLVDPTFEVTLVDRVSGTTRMFEPNAILTTEAEWSIADEIGTRDWAIILPKPSGTVGGSGSFSVADATAFEQVGGTVPEGFRTK